MAKLVRYQDNQSRGCWAHIVLDDGAPCWISVARTGILVKRSRIGLLGAKIYEEKDARKAAAIGFALSSQHPETLTPQAMKNPVLSAFVNAVLHCRSLQQVKDMLGSALDDFRKDPPVFFTPKMEIPAANIPTEDMEILSKEDARAIFSMSRDQWEENLGQAVSSGAAQTMGTPDTGLAMAMRVHGAALIVKPDYGANVHRPEFIQVTVGYRGEEKSIPSKSDLEDAIEVAKRQMGPEFLVLGTIESVPQGMAVHFTIIERDSADHGPAA